MKSYEQLKQEAKEKAKADPMLSIAFDLKAIAHAMTGKEEYVYFYANDAEAIEIANWLASGGFRWMYSQNGRVTMRRVLSAESEPTPVCPACGVPAVLDAKHHGKKCGEVGG